MRIITMAKITLFVLFAVFIFSLSSSASAEVIKLKNGREIEGTILKETDKRIVVDIGGGEATFDKKDVAAIERTKAPDQYKKRRSEIAEKADKINAGYYSLPDNNVESIEFVFSTPGDKAVIDGIKKEDYSEAADRLDNMKLAAAYDILYDRLYVNVVDRPYLEDKRHRDSLDAMVKTDTAVLNSFWRAYKPYVMRLIDAKRDTVKWIRPEGSNMVVETLNEERVEKRFVFNSKNELQTIEALDGRYRFKIKETPKFEQYGTKYLVKSIETETQKLEEPKPKEPVKKDESALKDTKAPSPEPPKPSIGKFEIDYQTAKDIKVPKSVKFSFQNADPSLSLPGSGSVDFSNVEIKFKTGAK